METIKSKILKLQALVERGENGEATNAKRLLDKLLSKYGLTIEDVLAEKKKRSGINSMQGGNGRKACSSSVITRL